MKKFSLLGTILKTLLSLIALFAIFWFKLPPLNLRSRDFWSFITEAIIVIVIINAFGSILSFIRRVRSDGFESAVAKDGKKFSLKAFGKPVLAAVGAIVAVIVFSLAMDAVGAELFNAGSYKSLITLENGDFADDIAELSMTQIPVVDRDSSQQLGSRKLGEMSDLVSQFEIAEDYTQINYKDRPVRVSPLLYSDVFKWFNNQSNGVPAYIMVDMTTQETTLVRLKNGMKYSEGEYFMRNIKRYLRFKYPTKIFDEISFEIDDDGTPYWVASTVQYRIGLWSGYDIGGAVLVNAITGESKHYDFNAVPQWVDQVCSSSMIVDQLTFNGKYRSGFWNSIIGQNGVLQPTDGYNYLAIDDDVWLYTGMTSVVSDESNVGFVLVNLRTKESRYYEVPGAEEYSAMNSAEGAVQEKGYNATFPLLLNVSDRPTYFLSLKDAAGLVKMYAFIDVQQYQIVGTGSTVAKARESYITALSDEEVEIKVETEKPESVKKDGTVQLINTAVIGGNTKYFIMLQGDENVYIADITLSDALPFVKVGDKVKIESISTAKTTLTAFERTESRD